MITIEEIIDYLDQYQSDFAEFMEDEADLKVYRHKDKVQIDIFGYKKEEGK